MKKTLAYFLYTMLIACIVCACNDRLDIKQNYEFSVSNLPVPKRLKAGDVAEIRCNIIRSGYYEGARYYLHYYQPDGKGELRMEGGEPFLPNDTYSIPSDTFRLYFRCLSDEQQTIDLYFFDNFGNTFNLSFSFANDNTNKGQVE